MILTGKTLTPHAELDAYTFDPVGQDWGTLLAPFSPPLPREGEVVLASFFGDVYVEDKDGAVWWVNGLESRVERIALDREAFLDKVNIDHLPMLKTKLMEVLIMQNRLLKVGMLYGLKTPRSDGGRYEVDNVGTAPIADAFAFMGAQFKARNLTPQPVAKPQPAPKKKGWFN